MGILGPVKRGVVKKVLGASGHRRTAVRGAKFGQTTIL